MKINLCYIKKSFFIDNPNLIKVLDPQNTSKQSHRSHLCIRIKTNNNTFYIPLRNNLGDDLRKFGRIGHSIPSQSRPSAGLDYRYTLIINDESFIEKMTEIKIPKSQYKKIQKEYDLILFEFSVYLRGFIRAARKNRISKEPLYRESSLINFVDLLI